MNHVTVEVDMLIVIIVIGVVIALSVWSNRLGIAPPLILMVVGVGVSYFLSIPQINLEIPVIEPEWILAVILPPLLYAAAIAIPTVDLRRDFAAVGGLAVVLVIVSAVVLGFIFHWLIPGVSLPLGIAIGAILSPTDAAATTIVRRLGVPHRVGLILQGESLLNDATALVLLRSAIVAAGAVADSFSLWDAVGDFLWAALAAAVIGILVGWLGVQVRRIVRSPAPATAISLIVPFVAWLPAEVVHASGLVAAVAAGLTAAHLGPKHMDARQRLAERSNWHTMEFLLEGAVFLLMGLELRTLVNDVYADHETIGVALGLAGIGFLVVLILRSGYLAIVLQGTKARTERQNARRDRWRAADPQEREARMRARIERARPAVQAQFENHFDALMTRFRR
ncbi:MAG: sodium:proton antiporter, partial [Propionibacteriaceae bacterium]|nr:sodium:proton antiporter [Propionibacteriaceae bacterium]